MTSNEGNDNKPAGSFVKKRRSLGLSRNIHRKSYFKSPIIQTSGRNETDRTCLTTTVNVIPNDSLGLQTIATTNSGTIAPSPRVNGPNNIQTVNQDENKGISNGILVLPERKVVVETDGQSGSTSDTKESESLHDVANLLKTKTFSTPSGSMTAICNRNRCSNERTSRSLTPSSSRKRPCTQRNIFGKKFKTDFKSPVRNIGKTETAEEIQQSIDDLKERIRNVDDQIRNLEQQGYDLKEDQARIAKLHEYNELKDLGQFLIGQIASKEGTTTKQVYGRFGLNLDD